MGAAGPNRRGDNGSAGRSGRRGGRLPRRGDRHPGVRAAPGARPSGGGHGRSQDNGTQRGGVAVLAGGDRRGAARLARPAPGSRREGPVGTRRCGGRPAGRPRRRRTGGSAPAGGAAAAFGVAGESRLEPSRGLDRRLRGRTPRAGPRRRGGRPLPAGPAGMAAVHGGRAGRVARRGPSHRGGVREGPVGVRSPDRVVPGHTAPPGGRGHRRGGRPTSDVRGGLGPR